MTDKMVNRPTLTGSSATLYNAQPTVVTDTSEKMQSVAMHGSSEKGKGPVSEDDKVIFVAGREVYDDAVEHMATVNGDALLAAVLDIDTDEESDVTASDDGEVFAEQSHATIAGGATLLLSDDGDNDNELSEVLAPYANRQLINTEMSEYEKFTPHPTDPTKINAVFRMRMPDGSGWYVQKDVIPEVRQSSESDRYGEEDSIFPLNLESCKVPRKFKMKRDGSEPRWVNTAGHRWERTAEGKTDVFYVKTVHRRFDARTHKYVQLFSSTSKLLNIDPNDKRWAYGYNKWIDQIIRRADSEYVQVKQRSHWKPEEICAMYNGFNAFFHANGIDAYTRISNADLQTIADLVNAAGNHNRGIDAVRGQMHSSHGGKNKSLAYLRENLAELEEYMEAGGIISQNERFPQQWIPQAEFPTARRPNVRRADGAPVTYGGRKAKSIAVGTQTDDGTSDLHTILDLVNAAGNNDRGIDALKGQMNSSHGEKQFEEYIEAGGVISRDERYPQQWIPQDEFPTAPDPTYGGRNQTDTEM
ncbi:hypothetical protein GMOD_00003540 [Pyrenophora seminiperda CCB06]|uniref:Uncharacterized protein n=1 Tax=Pyrenophora seminiperda CCB06 TaxID=1302712 RepID=A0A3M7MJ17_9PLEO|nr:hypothetical protein GMOD_00003540 [Pyrenophora seminiperda CCB06]